MATAQKIFDFDKKGWYEQYFSYSFTEDVYHIALRTVNKIINNFPLSDSEKKQLKVTLKTFYSFQESAVTNNLNYRDHLIHQFQVFLIGLKIMSSKWWYEYIGTTSIDAQLFKGAYGIPWAIAALFHDIGYPFEKLEQLKIEYIKTLLLLEENVVLPDTVSQAILFGKLNKSENNDELLEMFYEMMKNATDSLSINRDAKEKFYWFFKKLFVEDRKHAVTSALFVYHTILEKMNIPDKNEITSAILFHDKQVWMDSIKSAAIIGNIDKLDDIINTFQIHTTIFSGLATKYCTDKFKDDNFNSQFISKTKGNCEKEMQDFIGILDSYYNGHKLWNDKVQASGPLWCFLLHRIFHKGPVLQKHRIKWKHRINPIKNPLQFLLLISDALQERGREIGEEVVFSECSPDLAMEDKTEGLVISLNKHKDCSNDDDFQLELLKTYVDLSLLKFIFDDNFYKIAYNYDNAANNSKIEITLLNKKDATNETP